MSSTSPKVLVKWATRSRPKLVLDRLPLWLVDDSVHVLMSIDADDPACNCPEFTLPILSTGRVTLRVGNSRSKVEAINDGVGNYPWDVMILGADDIFPVRTDYGKYVAGLLLAQWPDGDGMLQQDDGRVGETLNTIPIIGRKYFDRFGYVGHPAYRSLWVDNEWSDVASALGRLYYLPECVLRHDWVDALPLGREDPLHKRNEAYYDADCKTYSARRAAGFPATPDQPQGGQ
jgi:hypothetical protein